MIPSAPSVDEIIASSRYSDIGAVCRQSLLPISGYEDVPKVSLDIALLPVAHLLNDIKGKITIARQNCQCPKDGLDQDESAAIHLYTMESYPLEKCLYIVLNQALRSEYRNLLIPWFSYLKLLLTALWKLEPVTCSVWRGIRANIADQYQEGKTYTWWNLSSTTQSLTVLESPKFLGKTGIRTLFNIQCFDGRAIKNHSYYPDQAEILLLPGTHIEITGKIPSSGGLTIIHVRQIQPPYEFIKPPFKTQSSLSELTTGAAALDEIVPLSWAITTTSATGADTLTVPDLDLAQPLEKKKMFIYYKTRASEASYAGPHIEWIGTDVSGVAWIISGIEAALFEKLWINNKKIGDNSVAAICKGLIYTPGYLVELVMKNNNISSHGAKFIAIMLQSNKTLLILDISSNNIADEGVTVIGKALECNQALRQLDISSNSITSNGTTAIANMLLINKSLLILRMKNNQIGDDGALLLAEAIKTNTNLYKLNIQYNSKITDVGKRAIDSAAKNNTAGLSVYTEWYQICTIS